MEQTRIPVTDLPVVSTSNIDANWHPKAIIFDLLTALLDSWTLWNTSAGSADNGYKWRTRYLELTFGCGAYKPYEDLVNQAAHDAGLGPEVPARLLREWDNLKPWPEVESVFKKLKEKGYKMGVVTNCSIGLGRRAASNVGAWDGVVTAEEVGYVISSSSKFSFSFLLFVTFSFPPPSCYTRFHPPSLR
jgi:FMN phosphatase YigB (HAD superfamily)